MAFDPPTDFGYNIGVALEPLTEAAAERIAEGGPTFQEYAIGRRIYELEQGKASSTILSGAVAGNVAWATISLATNPLTGSTYTIGTDVYQLKAPAAAVTDNTYVAVATNADKDVVGAALAAAINGANVRNLHRSIFKIGGTVAARANGSKNLRAVYVASTDLLWVFAAGTPGGTLLQGTAPDIDLDATVTGGAAWSVANLNLSPGAGVQNMTVWRHRHAVTADEVTAGLVKFAVPFYSATYYGKVTAYTAANERKGTVKATVDVLSLAAGPISGTGIATLTLPGGGGDLADTDIAYLELWAPPVETLSVPVSEARVLDGRLDLIEAKINDGGTVEIRVDALEALALNGGALDLRVDALENGRSYTYSMTGVGDQIAMTVNATPVAFVAKATVPLNTMAIGDWCEWEAEVYSDGADSTPAETFKMLLGTAELESSVIATTAAADYVILRGRGYVSAATTMRVYKQLGEVKDATLTLGTHAAPANLTIQALTSARDVTVTGAADVGHADNKATIKSLRFTVHKRAA